MAQNKRFLGLGFTFNATDKGLEKKLTNVRNLFRDINKLSGNVSKNTGKIKMSGPSSIGSMKSKTSDKVLKSGQQKTGGIAAKTAAESVDFLRDIIGQYTKALGPEIGAAYKKSAGDVLDFAIKKGRSADRVLEDLTFNAEKMSKSAKFMGTQFESIKRVFVYIKKWANDVIDSFANFLDSLGVNLRDMIPKEVIAAFGVLKSIARPLKDFGSMIISKIFGAKDKKLQDKLSGRVDRVTRSIGDNKSLPTPQKSLATLVDMQESKQDGKKAGPFDKLKNFLQSLPLIGGLFSGLGSLKKLFDAFSSMKLPNMTKLFEIFESLSGPLEMLWNGIKFLSRNFLELVAPIIALTAAAVGFAKEIWNWKDSLISAFTGVGSLLSAVGEYLWTWVKITFQPVTDIVSSTLVPVFQLLGGVVKALWDVFAMFGKNIAKILGMSWDIVGSLSKSLATDVRTATQEMQLQNKVVSPQSPVGQQSMDNLSNQKASAENTGMLVDLAKKQNDLMNSLLEKMDEKGVQGPNAVKHEVFIRTNPKEIQAQVRREEVNYATVTGNDQ